jgi:hypothetical protein
VRGWLLNSTKSANSKWKPGASLTLICARIEFEYIRWYLIFSKLLPGSIWRRNNRCSSSPSQSPPSASRATAITIASMPCTPKLLFKSLQFICVFRMGHRMRRLSSVSFDTVAEVAPTSVPDEEQKEQVQQGSFAPSHASWQNRSSTNIQNLGEKKSKQINATNQARIRATNRNSIGYRLVPPLMRLPLPFHSLFYRAPIRHMGLPSLDHSPSLTNRHSWPAGPPQ